MRLPARRAHLHGNYWAFLLHRISGIALAVFLPFHFLVLALAIRGGASLDGFLSWTASPLVKTAECVLVLLLAAHLTGGLRLLAIEFLAWRDWQRTTVALTLGASLAIGLVFALNV